MGIQTEGAGRELVVKFTCKRCGDIDYLPYDDCMKGEHYDYLHNSTLPVRWSKIDYPETLLCPECTKAYKVFMRQEVEL